MYPSPQEASTACAAKILNVLRAALERQPRASLAISGGTTPKLMFADLAKAAFDWSAVHLFWVDERGVPPDDPQSNYKLARDAGFTRLFSEENIHRVHAELEPEAAARLYADEIRAFFDLSPGDLPAFDIIHRGMGPDAHTASLFPGDDKIGDTKNLTAAVYVDKFKQWRITLLPGVLSAARNTLMLVAGADKAEPLRAILAGPYDPQKYPVQIATQPNQQAPGSQAFWFLDRAAARLIAE